MKQADTTWWRSVTTQEVRGSKALVEGLLDAEIADEPEVIERLARAAAIQQLLADDTTLPRLFDQAGQRTVHGTSGKPPEEAGAWLDKCRVLEAIFERALELLGDGKDVNLFALFLTFSRAAILKRGINASEVFSQGTTKPISVPARRLFRSRGL